MSRRDLIASAFLATLVESSGGDLRVAFTHLCARVSLTDLDGEDFQAALSRAVGQLLGERSARAILPSGLPANDA